VWFRFDLAVAVDPGRLGINLALDVDGDPKNGNAWWAVNTSFRYDRLVSVWVGRGGDGRYRGSVGTADAGEVAAGRYATSGAGTVSFAVDPSNRSTLVGVDRAVFGERGRVRLVAAVGSNTDWNDVAPEAGSAVLELER
jgi:hypothetical protein